jgi:glycosyltransferase involved in cell wall biosynthesis
VKVLGFCEGARARSGGVGNIGAPVIHDVLAQVGHRTTLVVGGRDAPSVPGAVADQHPAAGVLTFPAYGRWCYAPSMYASARAAAEGTDFIALHSLYSYPVLAGYRLARRYGKPYGLWPHGVLAPVQRRVGTVRKRVYGSVWADRILSNASLLVYSAEGERDEARQLGLAAPSVVVPHGLDMRPFETLPTRGQFRERYLAGHEGPVVLYLGRLNAKKGIDVLVASMVAVLRTHPDARLVIAGGGDPLSFSAKVAGWVRQAGIEHATVLTGVLDAPTRMQALVDCDVFATASTAENFGFAMFEALAAGCAVICSRTLNYADHVGQADAGMVVDQNAEALAAAVDRLLRDPDRRRALSRNGVALASRFSLENCGRLLDLALRSVVEREPFPRELKPERPEPRPEPRTR